MARRQLRHGRSLLLTALIGALISSASSLHSTMRADLEVLGDGGSGSGSRGKSSSSKSSEKNEEKSSSSKSSEKREGSKSSKSSESGNANNQGNTQGGGQGSGVTGGGVGGAIGGVTGGLGGGEVAGGGGKQGSPPGNSGGGSDEERKRAEGDRKRAEEEWKQIESDRMRIEEEARQRLRHEEEERQRRMEEARKNTQPPVGGEEKETQQGCFSISGEWTTDRALCMQPTPTQAQGKSEKHSDEERIQQAQKEEIRKKMESRYRASPEMDQKRVVLLSLISETIQRLGALRDVGIVTNAEQQQFVDSSIEWLRGGETYFMEHRSEEEVDQMVVYIRQIAEYGQEIVSQARTVAANEDRMQPNIGDIFLRTERLLLVFPDVLAILTREGITVDPSLSSDYETLVQYFHTVKDACTQNAASCSALEDVLTGMQHLQASVKSVLAAAGKPEMETLIHEVVESRTK